MSRAKTDRTRPRPVTNPLITAWSMFTVLPAPDVGIVERDRAEKVIAALPWVGLAVGLLAALATGVVRALNGGPILAGIVGLAVLQATTGFMHLDGLADCADGLGSRKPTPEALAIMKQSDIGPMGVAAMVLVIAVDAAALVAPGMDFWRQLGVVLTAPLVARATVLFATRVGLATARPGGFGALFASVTKPSTIVASLGVILVLVAAVALGASALDTGVSWWAAGHGGLAAVLAWVFGAIWHRHLVNRFGGFTGDTLGSQIEMTQLAYLLVWAIL